jgi:hypothetical protein
MDSKDIRDLANNPEFISGIYNYCDRWCERCPFTARCMVYALEEQESKEGPGEADLRNEEFWQKLQENFQAALDMLQEAAQERGIDLEAPDPNFEATERKRHRKAKRDPLTQQAQNYADAVDQWFLAEFPDGGSESELALDDEGILDAAQVLRWYQHQIMIKMMRALTSAQDEQEIPAEPGEEQFPRDSDGSMKVALIGIDRSILAWTRLRERFPAKGDGVLDLLVHLDRLRRAAEKRFPHAREFKRPGFDG